MSSINQFPTFNYSQPEEYRFSHDSVFLARKVFEETKDQYFSGQKMLDVCAGSGIVGLDFLFHRRLESKDCPEMFHFLEVQEVYEQHFQENTKRLGQVATRVTFQCENYDILMDSKMENTYDLIVGNPPYFDPNSGKLSDSNFKNRCRFFLDSSFDNLMQGIKNSLTPSGTAYLILRELPPTRWSFERIGDIRGNHFIRIKK